MSGNLILVLNCGSSSLKFAVISPQEGTEFVSGLAECFNLEDARIKWKVNGAKESQDLGAGASHAEALEFIVEKILGQHPDIASKITALVTALCTVVRSHSLLSLQIPFCKVFVMRFHLHRYTTQRIYRY